MIGVWWFALGLVCGVVPMGFSALRMVERARRPIVIHVQDLQIGDAPLYRTTEQDSGLLRSLHEPSRQP